MAKRRYRRSGLGDLLSQRAISIANKVHRSGKSPDPAKIEAAASNSLCREGHKEYCAGVGARRTQRAADRKVAAYRRCMQVNAEMESYGMKPKHTCVDPSVVESPSASSASRASSAKAKTPRKRKPLATYAVGKARALTAKNKLKKGCKYVGNGKIRCKTKNP